MSSLSYHQQIPLVQIYNENLNRTPSPFVLSQSSSFLDLRSQPLVKDWKPRTPTALNREKNGFRKPARYFQAQDKKKPQQLKLKNLRIRQTNNSHVAKTTTESRFKRSKRLFPSSHFAQAFTQKAFRGVQNRHNNPQATHSKNPKRTKSSRGSFTSLIEANNTPHH